MSEPAAVPLGPGALVRFAWAQLTSMRTALVLLFALALAAIPGSFIPQRPANPFRVTEFKQANPGLAEAYERLGLFDVYASAWFAAVYLLLLVSLVGCILPRIAVYLRALRTPPPATPRHLGRLPAHASGVSALGVSDALAAGEASLRASRFRVVRTFDEASGSGTLAAERGYLREFGNLVFHLSLITLLAGVAWNSLWGYKGEVIVVEGQAFSNSLTQFDDFRAGAAFTPGDLTPFTIAVDEFVARFETGPVQRGAAREFRASVRTQAVGGPETPGTLEVNHPVRIGHTAVHLVGHGYAPVVTVTDPQGNVAFSGPTVFLPQDGQFTSLGVIKAPDARPQRLAFEGFFLPTGVVDAQGPRSIFPDALQPQLFLTVWTGPPKVETGRPESVYSIDKTTMTQLTTANGGLVSFKIEPGQVVDLPDGSKLSFDDWRRWTKLQVASAPGLGLAAASVVVFVAGMCLSLFVRPRRLWLRVSEAEGETRVAVGGLDRADSRDGLTEDVTTLAAAAGVPTTGSTAAEPEEENP